VKQRRAEGTDRGDLLSMLLAAVDEEGDGGRLDDRQVRDEAMTLLLAGHDTTAAGLEWICFLLARHPHVADRCREEIRQVVDHAGTGAIDVSRLSYVQATVKESLRLYPPAFGIFLRQAMKDLRLGGFDVPQGSLIMLSSYVTQRDERWFPDPEKFRPERFLTSEAARIPSGAYFPFGAGPRVCIGQAFAMSEMTLVAAALLEQGVFSMPPGMNDPTPKVLASLRPKEPLVLRWTRDPISKTSSPGQNRQQEVGRVE